MRSVQVSTPDKNESAWVPAGTVAGDLLDRGTEDNPVVAAMVNNSVTSLSYPIEVHSQLEPIKLIEEEGLRVYRRTLCFLLAIASRNVFGDRRLVIGHSLGDGYYYTYDDANRIDQAGIERLSQEMYNLVEQNHPIDREVMSYHDALQHFRHAAMPDTALLLEHRNDHKIPVYRCNDFIDLSHGPLAPCTGTIRWFELMLYGQGFLLRYPSAEKPTEIEPFQDIPILFSIYQEYKEWGRILEVSSAGQLNQLGRSKQMKEFIWVAEALHNKKISEIADQIVARYPEARVVLIAGPSSSGKTTFTKKLGIQLRALGIRPVTVNLDNYFVPRDETPLDEHGEPDFEALEAIDVRLLNEDLLALFEGEEVNTPTFDFKSGERVYDDQFLKLPQRGIVLIEGIHGLNDRLTPLIDDRLKYRIYVSALTQMNLDDHTRVSTTDNRLIRRLVRDAQFRGHSAVETFAMWPSVRRGENRNIFPYQDHADSAFNSALDFELGALKPYAEPLLRDVKPNDVVYHQAVRLISFLDNFLTIPTHYIPDQSILREFIGQSAFKY